MSEVNDMKAVADLRREIARLTAERDFAIAAHDGQVQDKDYLAGQVVKLRAVLKMGVQLCESGGHGKGEKCPTCHFMRVAQAALANEQKP